MDLEHKYRSELAKVSGSPAASAVLDRRKADDSLALALEAEVQLERTEVVSARDPGSSDCFASDDEADAEPAVRT